MKNKCLVADKESKQAWHEH